MKKFNFSSLRNGNYFSPLEREIILLENSFSFSIVPNNKKLKNYFSNNQMLPKFVN